MIQETKFTKLFSAWKDLGEDIFKLKQTFENQSRVISSDQLKSWTIRVKSAAIKIDVLLFQSILAIKKNNQKLQKEEEMKEKFVAVNKIK